MTAVLLFEPFSYYPLYPPVEEVNMDYEKFQSFGQMSLTPDVLIIPSELRYFVKVQSFHIAPHKNEFNFIYIFMEKNINLNFLVACQFGLRRMVKNIYWCHFNI